MIEKDKRQEDLSNLATPRPINVRLDRDEDGNWITLVKDSHAICKLNVEDADTLFTAIRLLTGLLSADCVKGEIEQLRDLLLEEVGS